MTPIKTWKLIPLCQWIQWYHDLDQIISSKGGCPHASQIHSHFSFHPHLLAAIMQQGAAEVGEKCHD